MQSPKKGIYFFQSLYEPLSLWSPQAGELASNLRVKGDTF